MFWSNDFILQRVPFIERAPIERMRDPNAMPFTMTPWRVLTQDPRSRTYLRIAKDAPAHNGEARDAGHKPTDNASMPRAVNRR